MIWLIVFGAMTLILSAPALIYGHCIGRIVSRFIRPPS